MPRTPPAPPHGTVTINGSTYPITLSQAVISYISAESYEREANVGSLNSGVAAAQSKADTATAQATSAQATANAASQTAQAVASNGFSVTLNVPFLYEFSQDAGVQTTAAAVVTPSGGTAPYTYAWSLVSGNALTVGSATAASTTFAGDPSLEAEGALTAEYKCLVTDSALVEAEIVIGVTLVYLSI